MKVKEAMMSTPYTCPKDANLGVAAELMWKGSCGFLPVTGNDGKVCGVVTDRDICIALATRNKLAGEVSVQDVASNKLFACQPEDEIHVALLTMREGKVRRLPVINSDGKAVGVLSMDDVLLHAEPSGTGRIVELSTDEVVRTYRAINQRDLPAPKKQAAAA
ncbi:MAG TPA: CBS domain-containing protein [Candidatus Angelobacter sp.]|nr:CBS domain-containing protein [Candidatus Angelobacter sp.]